jgi:hypothetical protein
VSITITVEDGSVVTGANSFISLADWKTWADQRGRDYSSYTDEVIKAKLIQGADYLNGLSWKGYPTDRANPMSWPRYGEEVGGNLNNLLEAQAGNYIGVLDRNGYYIGLDEVPPEVVSAQSEAVWLLLQGNTLEPVLDRGGGIKSKRVEGAVAVEYFTGASSYTKFVAIERRLSGLLKSMSTSWIMRA